MVGPWRLEVRRILPSTLLLAFIYRRRIEFTCTRRLVVRQVLTGRPRRQITCKVIATAFELVLLFVVRRVVDRPLELLHRWVEEHVDLAVVTRRLALFCF